MTWPKIVLLAIYALSLTLTVSSIGKPRKPLEPNVAACSLLFTGVMAWLVVIA